MNPVLAACQLVNVSEPGCEPPLTEATEDMRLFSPELADKKGESGIHVCSSHCTGLMNSVLLGCLSADDAIYGYAPAVKRR